MYINPTTSARGRIRGGREGVIQNPARERGVTQNPAREREELLKIQQEDKRERGRGRENVKVVVLVYTT